MFGLESLLVTAALFAEMLLALVGGGRAGARHRAAVGREPPGIGVIDGFVFALVGLLIAFTFSGAASRFEKRRDLIVTEANAIGTAWLRLDLLPARRGESHNAKRNPRGDRGKR